MWRWANSGLRADSSGDVERKSPVYSRGLRGGPFPTRDGAIMSRAGLEPATKGLTCHSGFPRPPLWGSGLDYIFTLSGALLIVSEDSLKRLLEGCLLVAMPRGLGFQHTATSTQRILFLLRWGSCERPLLYH